MTRLLVTAFVLAACSAAPPPPAKPAEPVTTAGDATCPLEVPGTSVTVEDTADGAALVFVTTGKLDEVRARAKQLADAANNHAAAPGSLAEMMPKPATATATDVEGGARVVFSASDAGKLQSDLRMHAHHLSAGSCKMKGM